MLLSQLAEREIDHAIVEAGGNPHLLRPHIAACVRPEIHHGKVSMTIVDGNGNNRANPATMERLTLSELVDELKADEKFRAAFTATVTPSSVSAAKANPPASTNPFSSAHRFRPEHPKVILSRAEAKDPQIYRAAVKQAGGVENVIIEAR